MIVTTYAIKFRKAVLIGIVLLALAGVDAYRVLPREQFPDVTIPHIYVTAPYKGTAPEDVEKLIAIPMERKLNEVEGIKELRSSSGENLCFIDIEFVAGTDINIARQRVKDKVDLARPDLPADLDEPVVDGRNFSSDIPVLIFTLSGDPDLQRLKNLAELLKDRIERLADVRDVVISGGLEREIRVEADLVRLAAYDLPLGRLLQRIADENVTITAGSLEAGGHKYLVRIPGEFALASSMRDMAVAGAAGHPVFLRDVAVITDGFKDVDSLSRINGKPCVSLSVKKRDGINVVSTIQEIRRILGDTILPPGVQATTVFDQADEIARQIRELENNIFSGFLLVLVVLLVFMGLRNSLLVALAIPTSLLAAFIIMRAAGATLNMMTLFSLVLVIGMLVDNAIVIVENTYRLRQLGLSRVEASLRGAREVAWPVTTSTLTTVAAFLPLMYWPGMIGKFMWFLPWTVIVTLVASLGVALLFNPAVCSFFIGRQRGRARADGDPPRPHRFVRWYERLLRRSLEQRAATLTVGVAMLVVAFSAYARFGLGVVLFPVVDPRNADVFIRFPEGTPLERVDAAVRAVERAIPRTPDIQYVLANIGVGASADPLLGGVGSGTHRASLTIQFVPFEQRRGKTLALVDDIRNAIPSIPGAEVTVSRERMGPPVGAPVQVELSGDDFSTLSELTAQAEQRLAAIPGLVDVRHDYEDALPELQFQVDRTRAALYGMDAREIGTFLRMSIFGLEASTYRAGKDEYDITVRLPKNQRDTLSLLANVRLPAVNGDSVPLTSLGKTVYTGGRGEIRRKNQKRVITISGNDQGRGLDRILADVKDAMAGLRLPAGYALEMTGENKEQQEASAFLLRAFLIATGLILLILVIQFNSPAMPLVIYTSVAMSMIGVIFGLLVTHTKFSVVMTGLGVISLAGVVVNNAIVLIDCINQLRAEGMPVGEAIVQAGVRRLRPVLLTAVTTILGLIPMAAGWGLEVHTWPWKLTAGAESSAWWGPMAVAVLFGLALATVLTLVLVPALYSMVDQAAEALRRLRKSSGED